VVKGIPQIMWRQQLRKEGMRKGVLGLKFVPGVGKFFSASPHGLPYKEISHDLPIGI